MQVIPETSNELLFILDELSHHSFTPKNLIHFVKNIEQPSNFFTNTNTNTNTNTKKLCSSNKEHAGNNAIHKKEKYFDPFLTQKDSLFWCFYVLFFGFDKYDMLGNQHFVEEKKIKFQYIEILRSKKDLLKMYKIKPLSEIEDELANKDFIEIKTFVALCIISNLNVMIIDKRKYYEVNMNDTSKVAVIHKYTQPLKFVMDLEAEANEEKIMDYRKHLFKLDTLNYKIKSMQSYKMEELILMCDKLGIQLKEGSENKKITKKVLYDEIFLHF